jgi:hypothetical protein
MAWATLDFLEQKVYGRIDHRELREKIRLLPVSPVSFIAFAGRFPI